MRACVNVLCVRVRLLVDACWSLSLWSCVDGPHVSRVSPVCVHVRACRSACLAYLSCVCLRVRVVCTPPNVCFVCVFFVSISPLHRVEL